jgi:carbon storage regulator
MLVLTRKMGERIFVDGGITITLCAIDRRTVRIGIDAPRGTAVFREEIAPEAALERAGATTEGRPS